MTIYKVKLKKTVKYKGNKYRGGSTITVETVEDAKLFEQLGHEVISDDVIDVENEEIIDEAGEEVDEDEDVTLDRDGIKEKLTTLGVQFKGNASTASLLELLNNSI